MPVTKTALKEMRVARRRQVRNKSARTLAKSNIAKAEKLIFSGDVDSSKEAVVKAISSLDKAAEKGIIHPSNAARRKSRLMKKLNKATASSVTKTEKSKK